MALYTPTYSFSDGIPADGGMVRHELLNIQNATNNIVSGQITDGTIVNADISSSAAIAISKTTLGTYTAWTTYAVTWTADSGTNPAIGNGTLTGHYSRIGNIVFFRVFMESGSTTTFGTAANWRISLPFAEGGYGTQMGGTAYYLDSGTAERAGYGIKIPSGAPYLHIGGEGTAFWDSTTPITWVVNDDFGVQGWYAL